MNLDDLKLWIDAYVHQHHTTYTGLVELTSSL